MDIPLKLLLADRIDNTWVIPLLPKELPGKVRIKRGNTLIISPLVSGLPITDGTTAKQFFAPGGNAEDNNYVTFQWENPGERGFDKVKNEAGDPRAIRVKVVPEAEALELAETIRLQLVTELRIQLQAKLLQVQEQQAKVDQTVEERIKVRLREVEDYEQTLKQQAADLQQQETKLKSELAEQEAQLFAELEQKQASLVQREQSIQAASNSLLNAKTEAKALLDAVEPYRLAVPLQTKQESGTLPEAVPLPEDLAQQWLTLLSVSGLLLPQNIAISYLLALMSACYSGSLVLLNGPVGVGKTSIIRSSAQVLGGTHKVVPVRPAWLDPSDLLGFFDPLSETFRPSPFLTALKDAKAKPDQLCLVCLDELNLARIENYGADLLSSLEYSRSNQERAFGSHDSQHGLLLYSPSLEHKLWEEAKFLNESPNRTSEQAQRLKHLQVLLEDYRSTFPLSSNLVLLGTLNSDETTYDLSPKVIDRSYVITYPPANLNPTKTNTTALAGDLVRLSIAALQTAIESTADFDRASNEWQLLLRWNQQYLAALGIPLGHRASREYQVFHAVTRVLGLSTEECLGHFVFTKILPRISFFKNGTTTELFEKWLQELEQTYRPYDPGDILLQLGKQLQDKRRANVRYWSKA